MAGTLDTSLVTSVRMAAFYDRYSGQRLLSSIEVNGSNVYTQHWVPPGGDPANLPVHTDANLSSLVSAIQIGVIPANRVAWIVNNNKQIPWHPEGDGYPFNVKRDLLRLDPFKQPESLGATDAIGTLTSHWHKVGSGTPPTVTVPDLSAYPGTSISSLMAAAGWVESIPVGDPLFVVEVIEVEDTAYTREPRTSTRRYSTNGGTTWTTIRPTDLSSITDIQEYLHGTWVTTGAAHSRTDRRWINWQSTAEQRRQFIPLSIPRDAIEIWFYIQDAGGTWNTSKFKLAGWVKLPITDLKKILPTYVGSGVEWTDEDGIYRIWGSQKGGGAASIGICYDSDLAEAGTWGIDLCFCTYPQVTLNEELEVGITTITLASGESFYLFEPGEVVTIPTEAQPAYAHDLLFRYASTVNGPTNNGYRFFLTVGAAYHTEIETGTNNIRSTVPDGATLISVREHLNNNFATLGIPFLATIISTASPTATTTFVPGGSWSSGHTGGGYDAGTEKLRIDTIASNYAVVTRGHLSTIAARHTAGQKLSGVIPPSKLRGMQILRVEGLSQDTLLETYFRREGER